ncbi:hypothetical protein FNV43_RR24088 [Rhamnella rubrinervis]|uniref:Uncharacterized protein n=1 Tax=Rhamnella rubrinervis TaxID=2594499 RepID=A0A8K0GPX5_9ROSA|nr:hypothetical protein FNV43_RR24088 [Rhamnella rubrinervis]
MTSLVHLDLSSNNFNCSIPTWIFRLSRLEFLSLANNGMTGTISSDITNLTSIIHLDLRGNDFEGKLPSLIGTQLCKLKVIELSYNKWNQLMSQVLDSLSGCVSDTLESLSISRGSIYGHLTKQIGKFKALTNLDLYANSISGPIPVSWRNLSSLTSLNLAYNHFNETLPEIYGQFLELKFFHISGNLLEGIVTEIPFANMTKLTSFWASGNRLTLKVGRDWIPPFQLDSLDMGSWHLGPRFPLWLRSQKTLTSLGLSNTGLEGVIPSWFWDSFEFDDLDLSNNHLRGRIQKLSKIAAPYSWIDLGHNHFEGPLPSLSSEMTHLDLSNNDFSGSICQFLCKRQGEFMKLVSIDLSHNHLSGNIPNCWSNWKQLASINLNYNKFNGTIPSSLYSLTFLQSLSLRSNNLSGDLSNLGLHNCIQLYILDLGENNFMGGIPGWIGARLLNMKILNLGSNNLHGHISEKLCALSSLHILDLSHNHLSGYIPKCFNNFSVMVSKNAHYYEVFLLNESMSFYIFEEEMYLVMKGQVLQYDENNVRLVTSIDLSGNFLTGHIPTEIVSLSNLLSLNLSMNLLTGEIPQKMGEMRALESIDFSMNKLSGEIPSSMSNLSFLSHLNLSYNNLRGRIPSGTQLQSFNASSYINNSLCGPPVTHNCSTDGPNENRTRFEDDDDDEMFSWLYIGMGVGFAVGFWGVCGSLFLNRTWRHNYFQFLDYMQDRIYVTSIIKMRWIHEKLGNHRHSQY